jgi:hypothetical protein
MSGLLNVYGPQSRLSEAETMAWLGLVTAAFAVYSFILRFGIGFPEALCAEDKPLEPSWQERVRMRLRRA